jgi:hypothetical protein
MLTRLEVRHPLSGDETNTYEFSLLFNLPEIPGQLASMVKAPSQSSLRVFPSQDAVGKLNFLGDRLEGIIESFMVDSVYLFPRGPRATHEISVAQNGVRPPNPYTLHIGFIT